MTNNEYLKIYLGNLFEKANGELLKSYNYKSFLKDEFEIINAFLIDKTLNQSKFNLFIQSIDVNTKSHFYLPVIMSVAASTFLNNYLSDESINYNIDDILQNKNGKQFKIIKIENKLYSLESKIRGKGKRVTFKNFQELSNYFLTTKKELKKRRTKIKFKNYETFFGSLFNIDNFPSRFSNKSVIILEKIKFIEAIENQSTIDIDFKKTIPFRWIGRNGINDNNSEFIHIEPMIYLVPDYETFKEHIYDRFEKIDSVVFIGKNKYEQCLTKIKRDIRTNKINRVIFIGSKDVFDFDNLIKWKWTFPELQILNSNDKIEHTIIEVTAENFSNSITEFKEMIQIIENEYFVDLKSIIYYSRHLFSLIATLDDTRLIKQVEYIRLNLIEKAKNILTETFLEIDENPYRIINNVIAGINSIFINLSCDKFIHLIIKDNIDLIIVPSFLKNAWEEAIDLHNIPPKRNIEILSIKEYFKKQSQYYRIWNVYILSLFSYQMDAYELIQSLCTTKHKINYLLYPEEKALYNEIKKKIEREQNDEYQSADRLKLSSIEFELNKNPEPINEKIEQLFYNYTDINHNYKHSNFEEIFYEIVFDNNEKVIIEGNKSIILINQSKISLKEKISNLRIGDKIRIYENTDRKKLLTLAIQEDDEGRFDTIFLYSKLWKKSLNEYYNKIDNIFYNENKLLDDLLTNGARLKLPTLKNWLDMNDDNYFPNRIENLRAIQRTIQNQEFDTKFKDILKSRKLYRSIMISLGHNLSDELTDYVISKKDIKGEFLKKFSSNQVDFFLNNTAPIKIIKKIEIIQRSLDE